MDRLEVLLNWLEREVEIEMACCSRRRRAKVNGKEVAFSCAEKLIEAMDAIVERVINAISQFTMGDEVKASISTYDCEYVDVEDIFSGEVLFSVRFREYSDWHVSPCTYYHYKYRPLRSIIEDAIEAVKGYLSVKKKVE